MSRLTRDEIIERLDRELRRTGSVSTLHNHAIAARVDLHPTDWDAIDTLDWTGPITAGQLARQLGLTSGAATGVIDRLERAGYVLRSRDPGDRRKVVVEIDASRTQGLRGLFDDLTVDIGTIQAHYTAGQLATIADYLAALNDAIEASTERVRSPD